MEGVGSEAKSGSGKPPCSYEVEGPWGGNGGSAWTDGTYSKITGITIGHGHVIDAIAVRYSLCDESTQHAILGNATHGGTGGAVTTIDFATDEYLIRITGHYGDFGGSNVITRLKFTTNVKEYGPYGKQTGTEFASANKGRMIVGFYGRAEKFLDKLGVYSWKDCVAVAPPPPYYEVEGPWGGKGGIEWTDGTYSDITGMTIRHGEAIDAITVRYGLRGKSTENAIIGKPTHGGTRGVAAEIKFSKNEYLIRIAGHYGNQDGQTVIKSLKFTTNVKEYGPYGSTKGTAFASAGIGKIVGFYGFSGIFLDKLGVYSIHNTTWPSSMYDHV